MTTNPLDDLAAFDPATLTKHHSSGRRELRAAILARGIPITARARSVVEQERAILTGEMVPTLPVKRKERKRPEGMSARQWRKMKQSARKDSQ